MNGLGMQYGDLIGMVKIVERLGVLYPVDERIPVLECRPPDDVHGTREAARQFWFHTAIIARARA